MKKNLTKLTSLLLLASLAWGGVEFRDASFEPVDGYSEMAYTIGKLEKKVYVASNILLDSAAIDEAYVTPSGTSTDHLGKTETLYGVAIVLTDKGAKEMKRITEVRISKPIAIIFEGKVLSVPVVRAEIGKNLTITGPGTKADAEALKEKLITSR